MAKLFGFIVVFFIYFIFLLFFILHVLILMEKYYYIKFSVLIKLIIF